jgi:hypothetical protein
MDCPRLPFDARAMRMGRDVTGGCIMRKAMARGLAAALSFAPLLLPAQAQDAVTHAYTSFDADKTCAYRRGRGDEDYGRWLCTGYAGIDVVLTAGDQRMNVSYGGQASREPAARETLPPFNNVYTGTIEWRVAKVKPFATILRWNFMLPDDERKATGRALVVTRLNPGGVCHVGYVDARANANPNELARQLADTKARTFRCGTDKAEWIGVKPASLD